MEILTMTYEDGDQVLLRDHKHGLLHAEVVGVRNNGYDVIRTMDFKVVRNVPSQELQLV